MADQPRSEVTATDNSKSAPESRVTWRPPLYPRGFPLRGFPVRGLPLGRGPGFGALGRGLDVALFGLLPDRRLPLESFFGYIAARNRVPLAYPINAFWAWSNTSRRACSRAKSAFCSESSARVPCRSSWSRTSSASSSFSTRAASARCSEAV